MSVSEFKEHFMDCE